MAIAALTRIFNFDAGKSNIEIKDPNPNLTVSEVQSFLSGQYPELLNASVEAPVYTDNNVTYTFKSNYGKKG